MIRAPAALLVDAASFLVSALLIARIRAREGLRQVGTTSTSIWHEAAGGLREIQRQGPVKTLAFTAAGIGMFNAMIEAVIILYLTRTIGVEPGVLGLMFAAGSGGFVVGAMLPVTLARRFGVGPTMTMAILAIGLSDLAIPLVGSNVVVVSLVVALSQFFFGIGITVFNVSQRTMLQDLVPNRSLGRVGGTLRTIGMWIIPIGALAGGVLGSTVGLQATLLCGAVLEASVAIGIWQSPLWSMRSIPPGSPS